MRQRQTNRSKRTAGFTLIEVVIAMGLVGVVAAGVGKLSVAVTRSQVSLDQRLDRLAIKSVLLTGLDCAHTLPENLGDCAGKPFLELKASQGTALFPIDGTPDHGGTSVGKWMLRARCEPGALVVETRAAQKQGSAWEPLFPPGLELCRGSFIPITGDPQVVVVTKIVQVPCDPTVSSCGTQTLECPKNPGRIGVNVCESVGEYRYDACISKGKKSKRCERKEKRVYRKCNKWAGQAGSSTIVTP